ncbi:hypothetical protein DOY81_004349 [Sarcophaga bullata]|nr:hypothetical protein DOY81_004349 [Sarcophaga bullata]
MPLEKEKLETNKEIIKDMHKKVSVQVDSYLALYLPEGVYEIKKMEPRSKIRTIIVFCLFLAIAGIIGFGYFCQDQVCALTKRSLILQPDLLSYNDIPPQPPLPPGAIGSASIQSVATGALMVHQHQQLQQQQQQQQLQPLPLASTKTIQQNNIIIANAGLSYDDVLNDDFQFDMDGHDVMVFLHIQKTGGTSFGRHLVRDLDLKRPCECQRQRKRCYCFRPHRNENWLFSRYSTGWKCGLHADWTELTSCVDQELDKNEGESAKRRYFYITLLREPIARYMSEYRHISQYIFEETFNLRFAIPFEQHNTTLSVSAIHNLRPDQRRHIEELNSLDIELYAFAKNLLFERFEHLKAKDNDFAKRFANLGNIYYKQGVTEFNWDSNIDETVSTGH